MRLVLISDTHGTRVDLPQGDVLVHAGDFSNLGTLAEVAAFDTWLAAQPHRHKIVIAGNHDRCFEREPEAARARLGSAIYLQDEGVTIDGVRFWGSPWQPAFMDWAFNLDRGEPLQEKWRQIPEDTDVLITHGPPFQHLDLTRTGENVGCADLLVALARVRPRVHLFGHIHEAYGREQLDGTQLVNASVCDIRYRPVNLPVIVDL